MHICLVAFLVQCVGSGLTSGQQGDTCLIGKNQSPIDLETFTKVERSDQDAVKIDDAHISLEFNLTNRGDYVHAKVCNPQANANKKYLVAIYFKWPAEHTIKGGRYPFEMGIVYYDDPIVDFNALHKMTVHAVLAKEGAANSEFEKFVSRLKHVQKQSDVVYSFNDSFNIANLFPSRKSYFRYNGSMSMPPCKETVPFRVLEDPITLSQAQMDAFKKLQLPDGSLISAAMRDTQPLNGRIVEYVPDE